jgi:hypothetical protein
VREIYTTITTLRKECEELEEQIKRRQELITSQKEKLKNPELAEAIESYEVLKKVFSAGIKANKE